MKRYLLDTHLIYWWMTADARLGKATQCGQIALLALPDFRVFPDLIDRRIHIGSGVVVQLFVLPRKSPGLLD